MHYLSLDRRSSLLESVSQSPEAGHPLCPSSPYSGGATVQLLPGGLLRSCTLGPNKVAFANLPAATKANV